MRDIFRRIQRRGESEKTQFSLIDIVDNNGDDVRKTTQMRNTKVRTCKRYIINVETNLEEFDIFRTSPSVR